MARAVVWYVSLVLCVAGCKGPTGQSASVEAHVLSRFGIEADIELPSGARVKVIGSSTNFPQTVLERRSLLIDLADGVSLHLSEVPADFAFGPKRCEPRPGREIIAKNDGSCILKRQHGILGKELYEVFLFHHIPSQPNLLKVSAQLTEPVGGTIVPGLLGEEQARHVLQVMETFAWHGPSPAELPDTAKPRSVWILVQGEPPSH